MLLARWPLVHFFIAWLFTSSISSTYSLINWNQGILLKKSQWSSSKLIPTSKLLNVMLSIKGGSSAVESKKKTTQKKKKKSKKLKKKKSNQKSPDSAKEEETNEGKDVINKAMKSGDFADSLGDAIRERADILRRDELLTSSNPVDVSIKSVGLALGTADFSTEINTSDANNDDPSSRQRRSDRGGGVETSPGPILANYFLHSHGGAHGIQSLLSFLSVMAGIGALVVPSPAFATSATDAAADAANSRLPGALKLTLIRRCLLCALAKHVSGMLAAAAMSASRIPDIGFFNAKKRIEELALDPVSQYLFYCALVLVWSPNPTITTLSANKKSSSERSSSVSMPWWIVGNNGLYSTVIFLAPILMREIVSTAWVISDIFVLLQTASVRDGTSDERKKDPLLLRTSRAMVNAIMSLLFTPRKWRSSDSAMRQKLLAQFVSKMSVAWELLAGLIIIYDSLRSFLSFSILSAESRPVTALSMVKSVLCARLYINFLLVRRKKIRDLMSSVRGGAAYVPGRILDALLEPKKAMGISVGWNEEGKAVAYERQKFIKDSRSRDDDRDMLRQMAFALGLEDP